MDSGQLQSVGKYSSGVPFIGKVAKITPPEQQLQQIIDAFVPVVQSIIDAIVPIIEHGVEVITQFWDEILKSYPDKRIVWLAFHHPKARVRKKNRNRIAKYMVKAVKCDDYD